jgi:selenide, water dikinase
VLDRILPSLPKQNHPDLLIGSDSYDDAGVFRVREDLALVQTLDFFTPIVDDAYEYGRVAAANSLSDVYAMGGRPITALNIVAFPDGKLPEEILSDILRGAADTCAQAGVIVVGGHSVSDTELKFGLSITGIIDPRKPFLSNGSAQVGDALVLTKPLGTGLISNAMMNDAASEEAVQNMTDVMVRLNRVAAEEAVACDAHAATDITGFGLLGHAREMAKASNVSIELLAGLLPVIDGAMEIAKSGSFYSGGEKRNLTFVQKDAEIRSEVTEEQIRLCSDPQTSGGLLISMPESQVEEFILRVKNRGEMAWHIGSVLDRAEFAIVLAQ